MAGSTLHLNRFFTTLRSLIWRTLLSNRFFTTLRFVQNDGSKIIPVRTVILSIRCRG